jgi:hypothetical protein
MSHLKIGQVRGRFGQRVRNRLSLRQRQIKHAIRALKTIMES